ncbi:MAG: hypothetical protein Q8P31_13480 [Bacillota bacterium]|nr:hypothetical protein [Bacillota bacterium]
MTRPQITTRARHAGAGSMVRLVVAAALVFARWYTWPTAAAPDLVQVARQHAEQAFPWVELGPTVTQTGRFGSYQLTFRGRRDEQAATVAVSVLITPEGPEVAGANVILGSPSNVPRRLAQLVMTMVFLVLVFFKAIPQTFGRKCPRDGSLLKLSEAVAVPSQYDNKGLTRPAIIQRTWACPRCDFRHVAALPDPNHRPSMYVDSTMLVSGRYMVSERLERVFSERRKETLARGVTDEQYAEKLRLAQASAGEATSRDSPWRQ